MELVYLSDLGQYMTNVFEFCFLREQLADSILEIKWNIQLLDFSILPETIINPEEYFLEIVVVLDAPLLGQSNKESVIKTLKNYFSIGLDNYTIREIDGNSYQVVRMQDYEKERYILAKGGNGIPERLKNFEVTISIESLLRASLSSPKTILSSDEIKNLGKSLGGFRA